MIGKRKRADLSRISILATPAHVANVTYTIHVESGPIMSLFPIVSMEARYEKIREKKEDN